MIKLHEGEIYLYNKKKGLTLFDPSKYRHNGYTVDHLYSSFKSNEVEKKKNQEVLESVKSRYPFIKGNTPREVLQHILSDDNLEIVETDKHRYLFSVDDEGYIDNVAYGEYMTQEVGDVPEDVTDGYYKIKNGRLYRDKRREEELWSL